MSLKECVINFHTRHTDQVICVNGGTKLNCNTYNSGIPSYAIYYALLVISVITNERS
jgi:hypothetical protein